jgi:hypothetical protein
MSFTAVLELATLVAYIVVILGGKQRREAGWKVLASMLLLIGAVQCASMAIVVCYTRERDVSLLTASRHICSTMMIGSSWDGNWISPGSYALFLGLLRYFQQHLSRCRHLCSRRKMDMNSFPANGMEDNKVNASGMNYAHVGHNIFVHNIALGALRTNRT